MTNTWERRIKALLRKAESTTSQAEAEALTSKAQELMVKYHIDAEKLRHTPNHDGDMCRHVIILKGTYISGKTRLLAGVGADMPGVQVLAHRWPNATAIIIIAEKQASIDIMCSILSQGEAAMKRWWKTEGKHHTTGHSPATVKNNYLEGFGLGAARRMNDIINTQPASGQLVLADADRRVEEYVNNMFPAAKRQPFGGKSTAGLEPGFQDGKKATVGASPQLR